MAKKKGKKDPFYKNAKVYGANKGNQASLDTGYGGGFSGRLGNAPQFGGVSLGSGGRSKSATSKKASKGGKGKPGKK